MAFKSKTSSSIGTSGSATTVTDTVGSGDTHTIIGLSLSNKVTSNITVTASITKNAGTLTYLVKDATVLPGGTLVVIGGDQKLVLEEGDIVQAYASAATSADAVVSYLV